MKLVKEIKVNGAYCEVSNEVAKAYNGMVKALNAMRRCPGVYTTDQETGETFATLITQALLKPHTRRRRVIL